MVELREWLRELGHLEPLPSAAPADPLSSRPSEPGSPATPLRPLSPPSPELATAAAAPLEAFITKPAGAAHARTPSTASQSSVASQVPARPTTPGIVTVVSAPSPSSTPAPSEDDTQFQTVQCHIDVGGIKIYYVPHGLVRPLFRVATDKVRILCGRPRRERGAANWLLRPSSTLALLQIRIVGNADVDRPRLSENPLCCEQVGVVGRRRLLEKTDRLTRCAEAFLRTRRVHTAAGHVPAHAGRLCVHGARARPGPRLHTAGDAHRADLVRYDGGGPAWGRVSAAPAGDARQRGLRAGARARSHDRCACALLAHIGEAASN